MADVWPLPELFDLVVASFDAEATAYSPDVSPPPQLWGRKALSEQGPLPRIVWVPGTDSQAGTFTAPINPVRRPTRSVLGFEELFSVYVLAQDVRAPDDERAQYLAVRNLSDAWIRHARAATTTNLTIRSAQWVEEINLKKRGACLRLDCSLLGAIVDASPTYLTADTAIEAGLIDTDDDGDTTILPE